MSALKELQTHLESDVLVERFTHAPSHISHSNEYSFAIQLLRANDYLLGVAMKDKGSLLSAMSNVAAIGLSLNPAAKEAYLVPRKGKICLDPSYAGLIKLATDSGSILWVQANIVYSIDTFADNGPGEKPTHTHDPFSKERGEFVGVYCVAKTKEGDHLTTTMSAAEVLAIRDGSEAFKKGGGPWKSHFSEMAKKTVIRRAFKTWTRSDKIEAESRLAKAVDLSNMNEGMELKISNPDLNQYTDTQKDFYNKLIEDSDALGMYVFQETIGQGVKSNLYHSFEKGSKGKMQAIVDDLYQRGYSQMMDYVEQMSNAKETCDDLKLQELKDDLNETEHDFIMERI